MMRTVLGLLMFAVLLVGGCCNKNLVAKESIELKVKKGPPCVMRLFVDGEEVQVIEHKDKPCPIN